MGTRDSLAAIVLAVGATLAACDHTPPKPPPSEGRGGVSGCASCHAEEVEGWRGSMHEQSFTSPDFQASYREEPLPFCAACHAPRRAELGDAVGASRGIDCESCHPGAEAHGRSASLSTDAAVASAPRAPVPCAKCHELAGVGSATLLQSTASEHAQSRYRDVPCASCHMRRGREGRADHRFRVSRDPAVLGRAIEVRDVTRAPESASFSLATLGVGHKMPTGDVFRALRVRAWLEEPDTGVVVADLETSLHRDWDAHRRAFGEGTQRPETGDSRLDDTKRVFELAIPERYATRALALRVGVVYVRGFEARGGTLSAFATTPILDATFPLSGGPTAH